jgi:hypothetical protein
MQFAIVVGMPINEIRRVNHCLGAGAASFRQDWTIEYIPAKRSRPEVHPTLLKAALEKARLYDHSHVIGVSKQDGAEKRAISQSIKSYFRFRWLDTSSLSYISNETPKYVEDFNRILQEEETWFSTVKPTDVLSPLLLPQACFETDPRHSDIWDLAEQYGDTGNIIGSGRAIQMFRDRHWQPCSVGGRRWTDTYDRIFDHSGPRHALAPFPRDWKYSFRIPSGFHFDVTVAHGRRFSLYDCNGVQHGAVAGGHINIDPHGHVR